MGGRGSNKILWEYVSHLFARHEKFIHLVAKITTPFSSPSSVPHQLSTPFRATRKGYGFRHAFCFHLLRHSRVTFLFRSLFCCSGWNGEWCWGVCWPITQGEIFLRRVLRHGDKNEFRGLNPSHSRSVSFARNKYLHPVWHAPPEPIR